ncbi:hypothetical protein LTR17_001568 [Elasticomyces elasticus]|nr:hypothetical protein LTR17_001568 [Elasticomyces elasticus]
MSSSEPDDVYDNPALDEEGALRAAKKPRGGIALTDMMQEEEDLGVVRIDYTMATEDDMADVKLIDEAIRERRQATRWDEMFQSLRTLRVFDCLRTCVLVADDTLRTTYVLDSLRADLSFMERVEPFVCEGLYEEEITRDLAGYQVGCTYYTLALNREWLCRPVKRKALLSQLPLLRVGEASADGLLNNADDVKAATKAVRALADRLREAYKTLRDEMSAWFKGRAADELLWIDLGKKRCRAIQRLAQKIISLAEQVYQDCEWYVRHGEVDQTHFEERRPNLECYLRKVTKMAIFTLLDSEREAERKYENGGPY